MKNSLPLSVALDRALAVIESGESERMESVDTVLKRMSEAELKDFEAEMITARGRLVVKVMIAEQVIGASVLRRIARQKSHKLDIADS